MRREIFRKTPQILVLLKQKQKSEQGALLVTVTAKVKHKLLAEKRKPSKVRDLWSLLKGSTIKMQLKSA